MAQSMSLYVLSAEKRSSHVTLVYKGHKLHHATDTPLNHTIQKPLFMVFVGFPEMYWN